MFRGCSGSYGQGKSKSAAFPRFAFQRDFSALLFNQTPSDRQSQPRTFIGSICVPLDLPEFLENNRLVLSSNTYPCIRYRYTNLVPTFNAIDVDSAILRRELDRIA